MLFFEPDQRDRTLLPHDPFKAMVIPRPVGWISTMSRSATPGWARISDSIEAHQSGSIVVSGEILRLSCTEGDAASSLTTSSSTR